MGKALLRLAVVGLPALLLIASFAALLMSVPAWGAGAHAGLSDWMPTAAGIVIGLPGAIIAGICLSNVLRSTSAAFSVAPLLLVFGLLALPIAIATETAVAVGVADPATYDRLLEPDGSSSLTSDVSLNAGRFRPRASWPALWSSRCFLTVSSPSPRWFTPARSPSTAASASSAVRTSSTPSMR